MTAPSCPALQAGDRVDLHGKPGTIISVYESGSWNTLGKLEPAARVQLDEVPGPNGVYAVPLRDLRRLPTGSDSCS